MADLTFTAVADQDDEQKKPDEQVYFLGRNVGVPGAAAPEAAEAGQTTDEPEIEIIYEDPRRSRDVESESNDAIEQLQAQYREAKARAEAAEQTKAAYDAAIIAAGHRDEISREYWAENERLKDAQNRFAQASRNFDDAEQAQIVTEIVQRTKYLNDLDEGYRRISEQATLPQAVQQQTVSDPFEAWIAGPGADLPDADKDYLRQRRDFIYAHPDHAEILQSAAKLAEKRYGMQPGTSEYHAFIDEQVGLDPDDVQPARPVSRARGGSTTTRRPIAAPVSRSSGRSNQSRVHLSEFDISEAKAMNIPLKDYAEIKAKANKREGQLSRADAGGRLHARFSVEDHY